jgi:hypothetical protein
MMSSFPGEAGMPRNGEETGVEIKVSLDHRVADALVVLGLDGQLPQQRRASMADRPNAVCSKLLFDKALAPLRYGVTATSSRPGIWMFCSPSASASTILAHTPSRCWVVGRRSRPSSTRRWLAVRETANGLGRLTSG